MTKTKPTNLSLDVKDIIQYIENNPHIKNKDAAILLLIAIKYNLDPAFVLLTEGDVQRLSQQNIIRLNSKGKAEINDEIFINRDKERELKISILEGIEEYRNIFKNLFVGSMGSPKGVQEKLTKWLKENPDYTMQDIIKAARYWVENKIKEVDNPMYIGQADYFIFKRNPDGTESSRLSSIIDLALEENDSRPFENLI